MWAIGWAFAFHHLEGWTAWNSFIFACIIVSTIGYGNIVPSSDAGKVSVILCGLAIPVFVIAVAWIGQVLNIGLQKALVRGARCAGRDPPSDKVKSAIIAVLVVAYLVSTIAVYCVMEGWRVIDSTYYVFCVFTTIGLFHLLTTVVPLHFFCAHANATERSGCPRLALSRVPTRCAYWP